MQPLPNCSKGTPTVDRRRPAGESTRLLWTPTDCAEAALTVIRLDESFYLGGGLGTRLVRAADQVAGCSDVGTANRRRAPTIQFTGGGVGFCGTEHESQLSFWTP